jgi:HPt (histidine-containing phosphotransfer) domain-containing protein
MENFSSTRVTNLDYLTELSKGNQQFIQDMINIFLEENPVEIELLSESVKEKQFESIKTYSHKLKSTVPFVGIGRFLDDDIAEMEELALQKENMPRIELLFENVRKVCQKAWEELKEFKS